AVARPVTRVVRPEPPREDRRAREEEPPAPRRHVEARRLPIAPAGHAAVIKADGSSDGSVELPAAIVSPAKRRGVLFPALPAAQAASGRMFIVDELRFDGDRPRARDVIDWLGRVGETGRALLVTAETDERVGRATANLKEFDLRTPGTLRLEDVLRAETVLVLRPALDGLAARATVGSAE